MLKRNFDGTPPDHSADRDWEPQAKRPNFTSSIDSSTSRDVSLNGYTVQTLSPAVPNSVKPYSMLAGLLEDIPKPVDKNAFFDNVLDYFDEKLVVDSRGFKKNNARDTEPAIIDLDADDNDPPPSKTNTKDNEQELPQMILNPKALMKAPNPTKIPPDVIPISDEKLRYESGTQLNKGERNPSPNRTSPNGNARVGEQRSNEDEFGPMPFSQMQQPACCIVEKLVDRFQYLEVTPLMEHEIFAYMKAGRPTPGIPCLGVTASFYDYHIWITGCPTLGKLFCWICLLFTSKLEKTQNSVWVREGFKAMSKLGRVMSKHILSSAHKEAVSLKEQMIKNRLVMNMSIKKDMAVKEGQNSNNATPSCSVPPSKSVSVQSDDPLNIQNFVDHEIMIANVCSLTTSSPKNPTQTPPPDSSIGLKIASNSINRGEPVVPKASQGRVNLPASHRQTRQNAKTKNLTQTPPPDSSIGLNITPNKINQGEPVVLKASQGRVNLPTSHRQTRQNTKTKNLTQTPPPDSSIGHNIIPHELTKGNQVVPKTSCVNLPKSGGQIPQPEICDLTQSDDCGESSPKMTEFSTPKEPFKENLPSEVQYCRLMEELKMKELTLKSLVKNQPPPPQNSTPTHSDKPKIRLLPRIDIRTLLIRHFPDRTFKGTEKQREEIINTGRPTPEMPGLVQEVDGVMRYFNKSYYDEFPWMCGSAELNRLYCWPCLLFNDQNHNSIWNTMGYNDIAHLSTAAKYHSISQAHLELTVSLKVFEELVKKSQPPKTDPAERNAIVTQKRLILKYLIDAVCFKKKQLNNTQVQHEGFGDFLKILSTFDIKLKTLLDPKSADYLTDFTPNVITNYSRETIVALKTILRRKIVEEVKNSAYVSFILKSVSNSRIALILRYTDSTGKVYERFHRFIKFGFGFQDSLLKTILAEVNKLKCSTRFVGITYDGGVLRPDQMESFNSNLRKELMAAYFFHYRDDNFKALLQQSLSHNPYCRSFFHLVTEFGKFLQDNHRVMHFMRRVENQMSERKPKDWDLKSWIVLTIRDHYSAIMEFLKQVANRSLAPNAWTNHVISQCSRFSVFLGLAETRFLLVLVSKIYLVLHPVIEAFQGEFDAKYWRTAVSEAYTVIKDIQICRFSETYKLAESMMSSGFSDDSATTKNKSKLSTMFNETIDWILAFMRYRSKYIDIWAYFDLSTNKIDSPVAKSQHNQAQFLMDLRECFPFFDYQKLASALVFAHNHWRFQKKTAAEAVRLMIEWDFKSVLPELHSFLLLILTVPQSSAHVSSPVSNKIAAYVEGKTQLKSADALLHIEKDLLASARNEENFYNDVIQIISEMKRTKEFTEIEESGKLSDQSKSMCSVNDVVVID